MRMTAGTKILIVDDEKDLVDMLAYHLDRKGYNKRGTGVMEIFFKDNGIGICEEDLEKIFEPYYRGKNASAEEGKGIGLSFVKEVIDLHGGRILVQSEPQKGSLFSILLPFKKDATMREVKKEFNENVKNP